MEPTHVKKIFMLTSHLTTGMITCKLCKTYILAIFRLAGKGSHVKQEDLVELLTDARIEA